MRECEGEREALGIPPSQRLRLRRQIAMVVGNRASVSPSRYLQVNDLKMEPELSFIATQFSAEDVWMNRWRNEQQDAWGRQIFEAGERACRSCNV